MRLTRWLKCKSKNISNTNVILPCREKDERNDKNIKILKKEKEEKINEEKNNIDNNQNENVAKEKKKIFKKDEDLFSPYDDSLLEFLNTNIDKDNGFLNSSTMNFSEANFNNINNNISNNNKNTNNNDNDKSINESMDSVQSSLIKDKCLIYKRDMETISFYIENFFKKYETYPSTKLRFYKYGRLLGKGAFGKVNLSLHTLTGRLVAIKSINKEKLKKETQRQKIKTETSIMKTLSKSDNIVKFFETFETQKHICIVMEYICAGDLLSYIKKRTKLSEPVAKFIFKQIILALDFIHKHNIVHRDIKLDNILIDLDNNIKICDFGVSKIIKQGDIMREQCGTPAYIAPEILLDKGYEGFGVDVWSAGVVLYAMLSGTVPFKGGDLKELHGNIIQGNYTKVKEISSEASHLIKRMLETDPDKRICVEDILTHPWVVGVDLNFWKTQNLFTNAEYVLLAKNNVDYRDSNNKDDMVENFDIYNIDTREDNENKNSHTKSLILAPFNSSLFDSENENDNEIFYDENLDIFSPDLLILNNAMKFGAKVKEINRNYELNNNQDIDNGVVISNDSDEKNNNQNGKDGGENNNNGNNGSGGMSPNSGNESYFNKVYSKLFTPPNELLDELQNNNIGNNINKEDEKEKKI